MGMVIIILLWKKRKKLWYFYVVASTLASGSLWPLASSAIWYGIVVLAV
jgi:hypothetical protein